MPLGPDNRYGVGWFGVETELETEQGAIREVDPRASRFWKIKNPHSRLPTTGARPLPRRGGARRRPGSAPVGGGNSRGCQPRARAVPGPQRGTGCAAGYAVLGRMVESCALCVAASISIDRWRSRG